ncbi:MAG: c-type cytochrome [Planctomycetes bacterium]|nr:c-type cytochrome [Planctomycetota bacterium]
MPVSEDRLYPRERLNHWFAISSVLMTASILWMIAVDYDRPWRGFQDRYFLGKAALAHLDYLDAMREERQQEIRAAQQSMDNAEALLAAESGAARERLEQQLTESELAFRKANGPWSRAKQVLDVTKDTYERAREQYGSKHARTQEALERLRKEETEVERLLKEKELWEDRKAELERGLRELERPVREAEKALADLMAIQEDAARKDREFRGVWKETGLLAGLPIIRGIINMPMLDFVAPKNTPARHQVNQLVLYDVRQQLNYLDSYTTDRCTTCHVAIDDPDFSKQTLARKLERALPGINEQLQRDGHEPLDLPSPPEWTGSGQLPAGRVTEHWDELSESQRDEYFDALLKVVNTYLELSDRKTINLNHPILAHPDLELYVSVGSPHPMARMGCTSCHGGNPQETDFVLAAHSPPTHEIEEEWAEEYYLRILGVPNATFEMVAHYWDRPMQVPKYTQAGCTKCHSQITDIARFEGERQGSRINLGRYLFTEVGCVSCHNVDALPGSRRVGPDLTHVASKLTPEFVQQWVFFPQKFRPSTWMPHFFLQENNRAQSAHESTDPDPVLRTETEVAAMTKYLFTLSKEWQPIAKPDGVEGDVDRGRQLFRSLGCLACHANLAEFGQEWITKDLMHRKKLDDETAEYRYKGMTYEQRVHYATEHFVDDRDTFLDPDQARFDPEADYHTPVFTRFAPELSGIGSKVRFDWLYSWLMEPQHYNLETKMPKMRLTPAEAADLAVYLLSLKYDGFEQREFEVDEKRARMADSLIFAILSSQRSERRSRMIMADEGGELTEMLVALLKSAKGQQEAYDLIRPMSLQGKKQMFLGNKMISHYGCYACHTIPGFKDATPPGTDLSKWAEKPISQLDFAFYGDAFHHMREKKEEVFGYLYPRDAEVLNHYSPTEDDLPEQVTHTHAAFAFHKMLNPRIWDRSKLKLPYDKLKMPNFYFTEEEAEALVTYLLSRRPSQINSALKVDYEQGTEGPIARGRSLTRELNCIACHQMEDNVPTIQQYFRRITDGELRFDETNAPPSLLGEGAKIQHNWMHEFLQQVEPLRPWLQVRMPSFYLTGEQSTTLVEYFAALSREDQATLGDVLAKIDERLGVPTVASNETETEAHPVLSRDWYRNESVKPLAAALRRWAIERRVMRGRDLDLLQASADRIDQAHADLLERSRFLSQLYDVEYPFVEPPTALSPTDRFERGMRFLNDMGCLKCHVLGPMAPGPARNTDDFVQMYRLDSVQGEGASATVILNGQPYAIGSVIDGHTIVSGENVYYDSGDVETRAIIEGPGPTGETERIALQAASAPNLGLTYKRLRRDWVVRWMLEPQWMQPGTKMPQNFRGGLSPFEGDPDYPGTSMDHIHLLVDTLFDAGRSNTRVALDKIVVAESDGEFDEDGGSAEEEFDD